MSVRLVPESKSLARGGVLIVPIAEDDPVVLPPGIDSPIRRDELLGALAADGFKGAAGKVSVCHRVSRGSTSSVIALGIGPVGEFHPEVLRFALGGLSRRFPEGLRDRRSVRLALALGASPWREASRGRVSVGEAFAAGRCPERADFDLEDLVQAAAEGWELGSYRFLAHQTRKKSRSHPALEIQLRGAKGVAGRRSKAGAERGQIVAEAVCLARDLANTPANALNPVGMAQQARAAAKRSGLTCEVLDEKALRREKMGALLSVGQGSDAASRLIVLRNRSVGSRGRRPLVMVGKAITFDSGGLSIKPARGMEDMKMDMSGGAAVLAAMEAVARLGIKAPVVGLIPSAENMINGSATRPGDVVKARSGLTIEVVNTDAEGRLILADALDYAKKYKPGLVVDLATLTGACLVALGDGISGICGNDSGALDRVRGAAAATGERVWELPLYREFFEQIRSDTADIKNSGGRNAGTITAAALLAQFIEGVPWCHVDIAGPAWSDKEAGYRHRGATGAGVRLLVELARSMG